MGRIGNRRSLLLLVAAGVTLAACGGSDGEDGAGAPPPPTRPQETVEPPGSRPPPSPQQPPAFGGGGMSEGEFEEFHDTQAEVVDESRQFTRSVARCTSGAQAGRFRACIDDAYDELVEDAVVADLVAEEALDDAARRCVAALRAYRVALAELLSAVERVRKSRSVQPGVPSALPQASQRYSELAADAVATCEPG